ncbi:hypothetical protein [Kineosporia succinea]|uniref:4-amino-4-deoxy-L-arabinose transferase-like glycosyltransferase n=1 Tax=Kineosporia succinea TaxID=84632 RepID=A0ABT9PBZ4_9ACTN|nr:hypothetical protein [Kineosporia succinea]MDP9830227.1 4-amino-4-deoxy-L-arabinose transferase-like glycosyltransferase [Kineosporia succinea]
MVDPEIAQLARRRQDRWLRLLAGLFLLVALAACGILYAADPDLPLWVFLAAPPLMLVPLLAPLAWLVRRRRRGSDQAQAPLLWGVEKERRVRIIKAVRAGEPVPEQDQDIAAQAAVNLVRQRRFLWWAPLLVLLWGWNLLTGDFVAWDVMRVIAIAVWVVLPVFVVRDVRRGCRWLERHT